MDSNQIQSIIDYEALAKEFFFFFFEACNESMDEEARLLSFYENVILYNVNEDEEKILALMEHTGEEYSECETHLDLDRYRVYTDREANEALDEYCEEHILSQIPDYLHKYFDDEEWKSDNSSDRGHYLGQSDGYEHEETINGNTYYIYKI